MAVQTAHNGNYICPFYIHKNTKLYDSFTITETVNITTSLTVEYILILSVNRK